MKKLLFITLLSLGNLFALSPFSLEGVNQVNLKVIDKSKLTTEQNLEKIKDDLKYNLEKLGVKTKTDQFSNFIVKIQGIHTKTAFVMHISMFIVEDTVPARNKNIENMSITYYKDDLFDSDAKEIQNDIYESIINYLLSDFMEQYKEENN
jgi:hypothetical protein